MKTVNIMVTAAAIALGGPAWAEEQAVTGTITGINRLTGSVAITSTQGVTVGSNAPQPAATPPEEFKVKDGALLDAVHAGDRVTYTVAETGGVKTITKLERQK